MNITELKVYTPAKDFEVSKRFYAAMGFEVVEAWGGNFDCKLGGAQFRLQNYYVEDWANNFMMQFWVDDLDAWYAHARGVIDGGKFSGSRMTEIQTHDGARLFHVIDPSGVLLIFID